MSFCVVPTSKPYGSITWVQHLATDADYAAVVGGLEFQLTGFEAIRNAVKMGCNVYR